MASVDITDLLSDPDVAGDTFTVIRRKEVVGLNGLPTIQTTVFENVVGAVYPTGDNSLVREEAFSTQTNTATVVTSFRLRGAGVDVNGDTYQGDVIQDGGDSYMVVTINDFSRYGAGFIEAECQAINYQSVAPT